MTREQQAYDKVLEGLYYFEANTCINVDPATWAKLITSVLVAKKEIDEKGASE